MLQTVTNAIRRYEYYHQKTCALLYWNIDHIALLMLVWETTKMCCPEHPLSSSGVAYWTPYSAVLSSLDTQLVRWISLWLLHCYNKQQLCLRFSQLSVGPRVCQLDSSLVITYIFKNAPNIFSYVVGYYHICWKTNLESYKKVRRQIQQVPPIKEGAGIKHCRV